ncbi:4'-phosphopantetheinyl transferase superfamily protein [Candidatus Pantoea deserta]|uniref:4'-phosphopantetheinyl transferase superfamily protein n=1 Tax=Candidatus Pantoea deserta TaxID=1869313 RepID=A0A3N4NMG4_9GAMM|nr:4'-phosphopantetheinyl transferase superfamily protein [Pantoea deserta]RPD97572.1 4'-phosphopantetheinyl transferase superfamily protein [Pantoea deserta]
MASHFVRWMGDPGIAADAMRMPQDVLDQARQLPDKRRGRFLIARLMLAQLMLRVYGINTLPALITQSNGRPAFADRDLPDFSIAYAGNMVGVLLAEEGGRAGLDMEIVRAHSRQTQEQLMQALTSGERAWINAQQDFMEAVTQIWTLRQSILKLTGEGSDHMESLQLHPAAGRLRSISYPDIQAVCDAEPTLVWSCALSPATQRLHLWEVDAARQWHALRDVEMNKPNIGPRTLRLTSSPLERSAHPQM